MVQVLVRSILFVGCTVTLGCGASSVKPGSTGADKAKAVGTASPGEPAAKADDHAGWWCPEHGVPESECSMCSQKVAKAAKAKGDWCEKHDRAKSICFVCDPSLKDKFAARYEAKYGKKPPEPEGQFEGIK